MTRSEIIEKLNHLKAEFEELSPLFDTPKDGLTKQETLRYISKKYSHIKSKVVEQQKELERAERLGFLNQDESAFLAPAISDVSLHCVARKGSRNEQELISSIYDGQSYCLYWLSQLDA